MYGRVDRGGAREGKKSLRKNKVFVHLVKNKHEQWLANQNKPVDALVSLPAPPLRKFVEALASSLRLHDGFCNLVSRKLIDDVERASKRAHQAGVEAMIIQSPDAEKQEALYQLCSQFLPGEIYCIVGVHPDNTKKTHDTRAIAQRVASLRPLTLKPETVAISAGIDLSRDISTHFPQEKLLQSLLELASEVELPVVLTCAGGSAMAERVVQFVSEAEVTRISLMHFGGTVQDLARIRELDNDDADDAEADETVPEEQQQQSVYRCEVYLYVTGALSDASELGTAQKELVCSMPIDRLLLASDSPHFTPQSIDDVWIRQSKNEPSNLPFVLTDLAKLLNQDERDLASKLLENSMRFYGLREPAAEDIPVTTTTPASAPEPVQTVNEAAAVDDDVPSSSSSLNNKKNSKKDKEREPEQTSTSKGKGKQKPPAKQEEEPKSVRGKGSVDVADRKPVERPKPRNINNDNLPATTVVPSTLENVNSKAIPIVVGQSQPVLASQTVLATPAKEAVQYACKRCRFNLFTEGHVVPHHRLDRSAASSGAECQIIFVESLLWTTNDETEDHVDHANDSDSDDDINADEGKITCPKCHSRLGRFSRVALMTCSCGAEKAPPAFAFSKKKIDLVLHVEDARAAIVSLRLEEEKLLEEGEESDDDHNSNSKKKKRQKKQKKTNAANFSSFRNKSYGVKAPGKAQSATAAADGSDDDDEK